MGLWKFCSVCFCLRSGGENKTMRVSAIAFEGFLTVGRRNKMVDVLKVQTNFLLVVGNVFFFVSGQENQNLKMCVARRISCTILGFNKKASVCCFFFSWGNWREKS